MVEIEINGKKIQAQKDSMIIQAADDAGIYIPRFCYHKKLSIAANCRMCLVEVEKSPKTLPACATPVTNEMRVFTKSPKALAAQKAIMEFLLINHPLDCPICDQGGECELQDLSMGYGEGISRFNEGKRSVFDEDLGPLIETEMTRCIHCTRCVRFGTEIAGISELGATGRGEHMRIGTYVKHAMQSELSGNVIDICPVGALTSKPFRFTARAWEMNQHASIAPHDCMGSNIYVHTSGKIFGSYTPVMRVVPRENEEINEVWISNRDRFSYEALNNKDRLIEPRMKINEKWQVVDWQTALKAVVTGLNVVRESMGAKHIGAVASPNSTVEELYLLQKLWRGLGSENIDHRLQQVDFDLTEEVAKVDKNCAPLYPGFQGFSISDLGQQEVVLLIGSNIRAEQPMACHRLRKAANRGMRILCINPINFDFYMPTETLVVSPNAIPYTLAAVLKALIGLTHQQPQQDLAMLLKDIQPDRQHVDMANTLKNAKKKIILLGALAINHPQATIIRALALQIASWALYGKFGELTTGANSAGAWLAGAIPHRGPAGEMRVLPGLNTKEMFDELLSAYVLLNVEPGLDTPYPREAKKALQEAKLVVVLSSFFDENLGQDADIFLPIAPFSEMAGTFVNVEGRWQSFQPCTIPKGEARPAWKVLRVLGNLFNLPGFDYDSVEQVRDEVKSLVDKITLPQHTVWHCPSRVSFPSNKPHRIIEWPMYSIDNLVRRASALQASLSHMETIRVHQDLADQLNLKEGDIVNGLPLIIDNQVAVNGVLVPAGLEKAIQFSGVFGPIDLNKE